MAHFRNYIEINTDFPKGLNILHGSNGQGKTNLLESISMLTTGRSAKAANDRETVGWSAINEPIPYTRIQAKVVDDPSLTNIELILQINQLQNTQKDGLVSYENDLLKTGRLQKALKLNGVRQKKINGAAIIKVVSTGPEEVTLLSGAPSERRRFLDETSIQTNPQFLDINQKYQKVISQRNALLRRMREEQGSRTTEIDAWEEEIVNLGSHILSNRYQLLRSMKEQLNQSYKYLSAESGDFNLVYIDSTGSSENSSQQNIRENFKKSLENNWGKDLAISTTSVGPHRDDFRTFLDKNDIGIFGSRGQQRVVSIALFLAEAKYIKDQTNKNPILLFDDPLSELDNLHRERFLEFGISIGEQIFLTTAEPKLIPEKNRKESTHYIVDQGIISTSNKTP